MRRHLCIAWLRFLIAAVSAPIILASATTWHLEALRARLQTRLDNLLAHANRSAH